MIHTFLRNLQTPLKKLFLPFSLDGNEALNEICNLIKGKRPCMIARMGSSEIQCMFTCDSPFPIKQLLKKRTYSNIKNCSGFFPITDDNVLQFTALMKKSMSECDMLGSWRLEEWFYKKYMKQCMRFELKYLSPENGEMWYSLLEGKKVLVIHPMADLIQLQYNESREKIWPNKKILPKFSKLTTIKAVNSLGGYINEYSSWFEALNHMKHEIDESDFEVALLGCGSYGFPLAAYIKSIGKKAIHVGGALQLLFGIKGKRWEGFHFINEAWVSPRIEDRPKNFKSVEGGCYW